MDGRSTWRSATIVPKGTATPLLKNSNGCSPVLAVEEGRSTIDALLPLVRASAWDEANGEARRGGGAASAIAASEACPLLNGEINRYGPGGIDINALFGHWHTEHCDSEQRHHH